MFLNETSERTNEEGECWSDFDLEIHWPEKYAQHPGTTHTPRMKMKQFSTL